MQRPQKKQANTIVVWEEIRALKAKRLIALNKLPGVRPVGIGESTDRCFEKIMTTITGEDVMEACGCDQLCLGVKAGIEGAIHGIVKSFKAHCNEGWGLLLQMLTMRLILSVGQFFFGMQESYGVVVSIPTFTTAVQRTTGRCHKLSGRHLQ